MRYLSEKAVVDKFASEFPLVHRSVIAQKVADIPASEAVPVINCKNCKCWKYNPVFNMSVCAKTNKIMEADGFCSNAERKYEYGE